MADTTITLRTWPARLVWWIVGPPVSLARQAYKDVLEDYRYFKIYRRDESRLWRIQKLHVLSSYYALGRPALAIASTLCFQCIVPPSYKYLLVAPSLASLILFLGKVPNPMLLAAVAGTLCRYLANPDSLYWATPDIL